MNTSYASRAVLTSSLLSIALLAGLTPATATEPAFPAAPEATPSVPAVPPSVPAAPPSVPEMTLPTEAAQPSSSPEPTAIAERELTPQDYAENAALLAELIGKDGAEMGQGLERLKATGDAQVPAPDESLQAQQGSRSAPNAAPLSEAAPMATNYWQPSSGVLGVDVSSHQGQYVNWNGAWNYGSRFAYVKATEAVSYKNPYFGTQYTQSGNRGMLRGAYHFAIPNVSSGAAQANYFVANGGGWSADGKTMPPLLDVEYNPYPELGNTCYDMTAAQMVSWMRDFSNRMVTLTGRKPMIYTTTDWWSRCTGNSSAFGDHALHIASYNNVGAGTLPRSWSYYSVWQYTSEGPVIGDWNQWNGSLASLQAFARGADPNRASIRSAADMVAVDPSGILWNYPATARGSYSARKQIGHGWSNARSIHSIDWNADGVLDILAQWKNGSLSIYLGQLSGGFQKPSQLAPSGWSGMRITAGAWVIGARPSILGVAHSGELHHWQQDGNGNLLRPRKIGHGFAGMPIVMTDHGGDGRQDVLALNSVGNLVLYKGTGSGGFAATVRPTIGWRWNVMKGISATTGFSGSGTSSLMATRSDGMLLNYPFQSGVWGSASQVGSGWSNYLIAGTPIW